MAGHQYVLFCNNPRLVHKLVARRITKYTASMSTYVDLPDGNWRLFKCGVVYNPGKYKGVNCYMDAYFAGGWAQSDAGNE